jgi:hypothetical protein
MRRLKSLGFAIGISLVTAAMTVTPAAAQTAGQQSDLQGINVWNSLIILIDRGGGIDPAILRNARQLADEIEDAYLACSCGNTPPALRRFARGPGDPNAVCVSPECERLNRLLEEARIFLNRVDTLSAEYLKAYRNRIW